MLVLASAGAYIIAVLAVRHSELRESQRLAKATASELQEIVKKRDWDAEAFYWLGMRLTDEGKHAEAVNALARASALNPKSATALAALGLALARTDRPMDAESVLLQAVALNPKAEYPNFVLGNLYGKYKRWEKAVIHLKAATEANPENIETAYLLAFCYGEVFQEDKKMALLEQLAKKRPDDVRILKSLGIVYLFFGKFPQATEVYRHTLKIAPKDMETRYLLGRGLAEQAATPEAFAEAEKELLTVKQQVPDNPGVRLALGMLYFRRNEPKKAIPELEFAIKNGIREHKTWLYLGQSYQRVGDAAKGQVYLKEFQKGASISRQVSQLENRLTNLPDTPENKKERGEVRMRLVKVYIEDKNYQRALNILNLIYQDSPQTPGLEALKAQCETGLQSTKHTTTSEDVNPMQGQ
jgi:tetratricopeptide (TPR) repeat protein